MSRGPRKTTAPTTEPTPAPAPRRRGVLTHHHILGVMSRMADLYEQLAPEVRHKVHAQMGDLIDHLPSTPAPARDEGETLQLPFNGEGKGAEDATTA